MALLVNGPFCVEPLQTFLIFSDYFINTTFLPVLTEQPQCNELLRELLSLPIREGGLGIVEPSKATESQYANSVLITSPLVSILTGKSSATVLDARYQMLQAKSTVYHSNCEQTKEHFDKIYQQLSVALKKCVDIACEKGASSWLSAIPIQRHGYALHKRAFYDAIAFCYGWRPPYLPTTCAYGKPFSIDHSLNCSFGGFPTIRHNELRDVTANLLSQVCSNVQITPHLQPLSGKILAHRTSNFDNQARLDISAKGFLEYIS